MLFPHEVCTQLLWGQRSWREKELCWISSTNCRAPCPQWNMVIEIKRVLKPWSHKQKICIKQSVLVTYLQMHQCFVCPTQKSDAKRVILTLEPCWFIHWRDYRCPWERNWSAYDSCLFTFEHHQWVKVNSVTTELWLYFISEIIILLNDLLRVPACNPTSLMPSESASRSKVEWNFYWTGYKEDNFFLVSLFKHLG